MYETAKLIVLTGLFLSACGQPVPSTPKDEVHPDGSDPHIPGILRIKGPTARKYKDCAAYSRLVVQWQQGNEHKQQMIATNTAQTLGAIDTNFLVKKDTTLGVLFDAQSSPVLNWVNVFSPLQKNFLSVVQLKRIDVDHMLINETVGESYSAPGTFDAFIFNKTSDGKEGYTPAFQRCPTASGVDVVPGFKYKIVTTAVSRNGVSLTNEQYLDFN